jgi:hypothetical protein
MPQRRGRVAAMGNIHTLIEQKGRQEALQFGEFGRQEIDAASSYLSDEENAIGYLYSGWCQAALPHRRLPDDQKWLLKNGNTSLIVEPGSRVGKTGELESVGVPYGSRARLILIYLQSEAIRTQSRDIELGGSLRKWMVRLDIPWGGANAAAVKDQANRISRCRMTFEITQGRATGLINQNIVDEALFLDNEEEGQGTLFVTKARLSDVFFTQLQKHPVPLEEAAIRGLSNNSMGLDVYAWLAYRLHSLKGPTAVPWKALMTQFGGGFGRIAHFKGEFLKNLKLALAVYPDAKVELDEDGVGLILHPSRPPVRKYPTRRVLLNSTP